MNRIEMTTVFATKSAPFFTALGRIEGKSRRAAGWAMMVGPAGGSAGPVQVVGRFPSARAAEVAARAVFAA